MLLANKIKQSEECITSKALGFKVFLESLRQGRLSAISVPRPSSQSIHESEPMPDHEHPCQTNHSEVLHYDRSEHELEKSMNNLSSGFPSRPAEGDQAIRNKLRVGVANRQRANCFRLPAYCFEPTKVELGDHLKDVKKEVPKLMMETARRGRAQREQDFSEMMERKDLIGEDRARKISGLNPNLVLKYCSIHQINSLSPLKEVLLFFTRLLDLLNFTLPEPKVEKYKNCVYFGQPIRRNQIYEGIVYYYSGAVYFGELFNSQRNGLGVDVDPIKNCIHKGEFRDGEMVGFFQVQKEGEKYFGELSEGKYHGRGKLITGEEVFQGEFNAGRKVYGSTLKQSTKKDFTSSKIGRQQRRQTPYWSAQKDFTSSRTQRWEFANNKIKPVKHLNLSSNIQLDSQRKRQNRRYVEETRDFSYALNHEVEGTFNPETSEALSIKRNSRVASMRIRQVGKLHSSRQPQVEQEEQRPLINKF